MLCTKLSLIRPSCSREEVKNVKKKYRQTNRRTDGRTDGQAMNNRQLGKFI